ncbi:MAG: T9SS type A sorting domain-containing protein [Lewinellaceae bacterium]|nr:T9SS type A sorting domain-containing protein [Lewinellaceae bacterium]
MTVVQGMDLAEAAADGPAVVVLVAVDLEVAAASVAAVDLAVVASEVAEQVVAGKPCRFINLIQFKLSKTQFTVYKTLIRLSITGLILLVFVFSGKAQLTIRVTAIPGNTPPGSSIYLTGTLNNWDPKDASKVLTPIGSGLFQVVVNPPVGELKFKFTRGNWDTVEGDANGAYLPDRVFNYTGQAATINLSILSWEGQGGPSGTAAANVQILDNMFSVPELNRTRRVWIYLPPDYANSNKNYPVLYMQDAQNLFNVQTSFSGEWKVDESLNQLFSKGDYGCIVVGIDNGGQYRLDEYSPWLNSQYNAGGQGDEYVDFLVNTLKPYIDLYYRTLPGRLTTGVAGSSMGGLISMYAFSERQDIFSKAGIFSPAFWYSGNNAASHVASHPKQGAARVYFLAGADEENDGSQTNYVVDDMMEVINALSAAGFSNSEKQVHIASDGQHAEWFWAREFPAAYTWLFSNAVSTSQDDKFKNTLGIYPNPAGSWVYFTGIDDTETIEVRLYSSSGRLLQKTNITGKEPLWTGDLASGAYVLKARKKGSKWMVAKLIR